MVSVSPDVDRKGAHIIARRNPTPVREPARALGILRGAQCGKCVRRPSHRAQIAAVKPKRSNVRLSEGAAVAFSEALVCPAQVNERLAAALRHEREFSWLD